MIYTVLIGDIQSSKKIPSISRQKIQTSIEKKFNKIDNKYTKEILSPLKITLGDEFQAVFKSPESAWGVVQEISREFRNLGIKGRFVIVEGELHTKINKAEPLKMDGPAFWKAREIINLKKCRYSFHLDKCRFDEIVNIFGEMIESIEDEWKKTQLLYINQLLDSKINTITDLAIYFGKNKATISRAFKRSKFDLYTKITNQIQEIIGGKYDDINS